MIKIFRYANTLTWKKFVVFHDDSISENYADTIQLVLGRDGAAAMLHVGGMEDIKNLLSDFPAHDLGNKFMVITRKYLVEEFINTVSNVYVH